MESRPTILIVEDEPSLREGLVDLLSREGHTVEAVGDGEAALARGSDPSIQMMLLDLMLPDRNGLQVLPEIRRLDPHLPVVVITAYSSLETAIDAMREGAFHYVPKPFKNEELHSILQRWLQR